MFSVPNNLVCAGWILLLVGILLGVLFISSPQEPGVYVVLTGIVLAIIGYVKEFRKSGKK